MPSRYIRAARLLPMALLLSSPARTLRAQSLEDLVDLEFNGQTSAVVVGLLHEGELDFLQAWGTVALDSDVEARPQDLVPYPAFTEVLLAVTIEALHDLGRLDADAPVGRYLPELADPLDQITLHQLLTNTAGLDDAALLPDQTWEEALDRLPPEAAMLPPGLAFSESRYSYPLAARVLERAAGLPLAEIVTRAVLEPLGMVRSTFDLDEAASMGLVTGYALDSIGVYEVDPPVEVGGLPVIFTSATDLLQFGAAWMQGGIRGSSPLPEGPPPSGMPAGMGFKDGAWINDFRGMPRVSAGPGAEGWGLTFRVYPESTTALVIWVNGGGSPILPNFTEGLLAENLELEDEQAPEVSPPPPLAASDWAGTYLNGEYKLVLEATGDRLFFVDGEERMPIAADDETGGYSARAREGRVQLRFVQVPGYRLVYLERKAFVRAVAGGSPPA